MAGLATKPLESLTKVTVIVWRAKVVRQWLRFRTQTTSNNTTSCSRNNSSKSPHTPFCLYFLNFLVQSFPVGAVLVLKSFQLILDKGAVIDQSIAHPEPGHRSQSCFPAGSRGTVQAPLRAAFLAPEVTFAGGIINKPHILQGLTPTKPWHLFQRRRSMGHFSTGLTTSLSCFFCSLIIFGRGTEAAVQRVCFLVYLWSWELINPLVIKAEPLIGAVCDSKMEPWTNHVETKPEVQAEEKALWSINKG